MTSLIDSVRDQMNPQGLEALRRETGADDTRIDTAITTAIAALTGSGGERTLGDAYEDAVRAVCAASRLEASPGRRVLSAVAPVLPAAIDAVRQADSLDEPALAGFLASEHERLTAGLPKAAAGIIGEIFKVHPGSYDRFIKKQD